MFYFVGREGESDFSDSRCGRLKTHVENRTLYLHVQCFFFFFNIINKAFNILVNIWGLINTLNDKEIFLFLKFRAFFYFYWLIFEV